MAAMLLDSNFNITLSYLSKSAWVFFQKHRGACMCTSPQTLKYLVSERL